jgi:hypothetical protein
MSRTLSILVILLTLGFVAAGSLRPRGAAADSPEGAVQALFAAARNRDWDRALHCVADAADLSKDDFAADLGGRNGSLRSYSELEGVDTSVLYQSGDEALVRARLRYYSSVGALEDTRDLKAVREAGAC